MMISLLCALRKMRYKKISGSFLRGMASRGLSFAEQVLVLAVSGNSMQQMCSFQWSVPASLTVLVHGTTVKVPHCLRDAVKLVRHAPVR
jgi:hypothetical protein